MAYNPYDTAALRNNKPVLAFSPDNRRFVDPNYYLDVTWDGRGWKARGGNEAAVVSCDLSARTCRQLFAGDKSDTFYDAVWLDGNKVAIVGDQDIGSRRAPTLRIVNLKTNSSLLYIGQPVARQKWLAAGGSQGYLSTRFAGIVFE